MHSCVVVLSSLRRIRTDKQLDEEDGRVSRYVVGHESPNTNR